MNVGDKLRRYSGKAESSRDPGYASREEREERKGRKGHCSVAPGVKERVLMRSSTKAHTLLYVGAHARFQ